MNWKPIERGKPVVKGIHQEYKGLLVLRIPLSEIPPPAWALFFEDPKGVSISVSMHPPRLTGNTVEMWPPDDEVEAYVEHVDARIAGANNMFKKEELPRIQRQARSEAEAKQDEERRIDAAKGKLENL